jgi:hypothetical protein
MSIPRPLAIFSHVPDTISPYERARKEIPALDPSEREGERVVGKRLMYRTRLESQN